MAPLGSHSHLSSGGKSYFLPLSPYRHHLGRLPGSLAPALGTGSRGAVLISWVMSPLAFEGRAGLQVKIISVCKGLPCTKPVFTCRLRPLATCGCKHRHGGSRSHTSFAHKLQKAGGLGLVLIIKGKQPHY